MNDDIVTRLRNNFAIKDYPMLKDHCHCCAIPKEWGGHHDNCLYDQAAHEIERLRKMLDDVLKRENKDNARQLDIVRKVEANRDMWRRALLHGVANIDNQCEGCEICEFIKRKHEEVGGMRGATFDSPK